MYRLVPCQFYFTFYISFPRDISRPIRPLNLIFYIWVKFSRTLKFLILSGWTELTLILIWSVMGHDSWLDLSPWLKPRGFIFGSHFQLSWKTNEKNWKFEKIKDFKSFEILDFNFFKFSNFSNFLNFRIQFSIFSSFQFQNWNLNFLQTQSRLEEKFQTLDRI